MEFNNCSPIYLQIIDSIKQDVVVGKLKTGQKMPSVRELAGKIKSILIQYKEYIKNSKEKKSLLLKRGMGTYLTDEEKINQVIRGRNI